MTLKNFYTANTAEPGDVFTCIVTCHISPRGYRLYRCQYPDAQISDGIPQGTRIEDPDSEIVATLFPIICHSGIKDDNY